MQAGGFNLQTAELKNVVIIRQRDGKHYGTVLDFQDVLKGKDERTFYLEPRDIVYVPRTKIADLNQWVDQYLTKMVPQVGLIYTRPLGDGTVGIGPR